MNNRERNAKEVQTMVNRFMLNETSYHGAGAIQEILTEVKARGFKKALIVTDKDLVKFQVVKKVTDLLDGAGYAYAIYDEVKANPSVEVVKKGVAAFKEAGADRGLGDETVKNFQRRFETGGLYERYPQLFPGADRPDQVRRGPVPSR